MGEPRLKEYCEGGNAVETWWYERKGNEYIPVRSKDLQPVLLPVGLQGSIVTLFRKLPDISRGIVR